MLEPPLSNLHTLVETAHDLHADKVPRPGGRCHAFWGSVEIPEIGPGTLTAPENLEAAGETAQEN